MAALEGDTVNGSVLAGQVCGAINSVEDAASIVESIMNQAEHVLQQWAGGTNA
jgi:enoyl-[acyl-carrier protein] reductase II